MTSVKAKQPNVYDLRKIFRELNAQYFDKKIIATVTWGKNQTPAFFGIYCRRKIKINPLLNQKWVPRGFVCYVVYHEMLHQVVRSKTTKGGRIYHHTKQFYKREKEFYRAKHWDHWEKSNIHRFRKIKGDFKRYCDRFGFKPDDYGKWFIYNKEKFKIIGLWPWAQYSIVARGSDKNLKRFSAKTVKKSFKKIAQFNTELNVQINLYSNKYFK